MVIGRFRLELLLRLISGFCNETTNHNHNSDHYPLQQTMNKNKNKKFIVDPNTNSYIIQINQ